MDWKNITHRLFGPRATTSRFRVPSLALEVEKGFAVGARLDRASRRIKRIGVRPVAPDNLPLGPQPLNQEQAAELQESFCGLASELGGSGGRLGVLLPDGAVRVTLLKFEALPDSLRESDALIRWRLKDYLPYPSQEARVSYDVLRNGSGPVEVLAMAARASVVAEYEAALERLNGQLTLVLPATAALLPLLPSAGQGQLLLHASGGGLTTVALAGGRVVLWRYEVVESEDGFRATAAAEVARVLARAHDHLNIEVQSVWVYARPPAPEDLATSVQAAIGREVSSLSCPQPYLAALRADEKEPFERYGMPFAGLIANG